MSKPTSVKSAVKLMDLKELTLIHQPPSSHLCGQACLAMILHLGLSEAVEEVGHKHSTKTKDLVKVLDRYGIVNSGRLKVCRRDRMRPKCRIAKLRRRNKYGGWHWVVCWKGNFYDPSPTPVNPMLWTETSHLSLGEK